MNIETSTIYKEKNISSSYYQVLLFSVMIFITLRISDQIMLYRQVKILGITVTAGVFIMPFYYFVGNIIAELFGYKISGNVIYFINTLKRKVDEYSQDNIFINPFSQNQFKQENAK